MKCLHEASNERILRQRRYFLGSLISNNGNINQLWKQSVEVSDERRIGAENCPRGHSSMRRKKKSN